MFSNHKSTNRTLALFTFFATLVLYTLTMAPTASFWDSGEFIAVAHGLQVNHPPGAPFYSLLGRLFSMVMPTAYVAASINFISALTSALTVMLLYLIVVRLVRQFRSHPDDMGIMDKIGMYGGGLLGAFSFAVTDTFWFNAAEAEVYAVSMFFTAIVVWLALKWSEYHDQPNNERWLVLIAYMFGLAIGVHLLNVLTIFFVALIIYFKKKDFTLLSISIAAGITVIAFLAIYPFTIQLLPGLMEEIGHASYGLIGPVSFMILVVALLTGGIYYTHKNDMRLANIVLLCYAMILIGYSSYALIFIRSIADPPIDENDPETVDAFISYLKREQYGSTPLLTGYTYDNAIGNIDQQEEVLFPRRYSGQPSHLQQYSNYSSDLDFFLDYQVNHMYIRYFNWNFIGRNSDIQDAGWQAGFIDTEHEDNPAHNSYFYLPFLLGLFGMIFHFQRDWRRALSVLALFLMTGLAIIVFLNQTPLQPRERDYAYVGSFFCFAIWIGMGGTGIIELVKHYLKTNTAMAFAVLGVLFAGVPGLMAYQNFDDHDRSDRYVAPDYAYNLLQSVAPNALIFTNGDNDTFPLWYLQEVEGVRTDVRIVCLSLLNTEWYIKQLRDQWSHESPPLPISLTNEEIEDMTQNLTLHEPQTYSIPVDKEMLKNAFSGDANYLKSLGITSDTTFDIFTQGIDFQMPVDSLDNRVEWYYEGRPAGTDGEGNRRYYTQVQDKVILDILRTNNWLRPVYFANTVSTSSQLNLQPYFRFEGKAFRVVPQRHEDAGQLGWVDAEIHANRLRKFRFREWDNPDAYFDENIRRMLGNYRMSITQLAEKFMETGKPDSASKWLKWGEDKIPFRFTYAGNSSLNSLVLYSYNYAQAGDSTNALRLADKGKQNLLKELRYSIEDYDRVQGRILSLNEETKQARMNADLSRQKELKDKIQGLISRRDNIAREINFAISHLTIIQRVYYMSGNEKKGNMLTDEVSAITSARIGLPANKEENKARMKQFGL